MEAVAQTTPSTSATPAPSAPTAAPAASAPTPGQRPTFAQAFASDAATTPETPAQPEAATTQPAESTETQAPVNPSVDAKGPIPFDVHKTALENARAKAVAEYKEKFGWAEQVDRALYEETAQIGHLYRSDKPAFFRQLLSEAAANPETLAVLRSESARFLAGARQQPAAAPQDEAGIPVVDDTGRVVARTYTDAQIKSLVDRVVAEAIGKEVTPLKADFQTRQQQEQARTQRAEAEKAVTSLYEQAVSELPQLKEHEAEIAKELEKIPGDPAVALHRAWAKVVLPKLQAANQAKTLDELKTKAAASVANPAAAAPVTTKRVTSFTDPALKWG